MKNFPLTLTVKEMIDKYKIVLATQNGKEGLMIYGIDAAKRDNAIESIKSAKEEIKAYLKAEKDEMERKARDRSERIAAIEGLKEIRDAINDLETWQYEFEKSFDDVGGLGVRPKPQYDIPGMKTRYPRAAAYLLAEEYSLKSNYELSAIGKKALDTIIYGDYSEAMIAMDKALKEFTDRHIWD